MQPTKYLFTVRRQYHPTIVPSATMVLTTSSGVASRSVLPRRDVQMQNTILATVLFLMINGVVMLCAAPVPKDFGTVNEDFTWKGQGRVRLVRTLVMGGERMEFVNVAKGSFRMGSPEADKDAADDEKPQRVITFTKPKWVGKYPITKGQFAAFVLATDYKTEGERDGYGGDGFDGKESFNRNVRFTWRQLGWPQTERYPVVNISWNDAASFCKWAAKASNLPIRLPTEAEHEHFNRGGERTIFLSGDRIEDIDGFSNIADISAKKVWGSPWKTPFEDGEAFSSAVGKYKPNGYGLHDTTGNVWCWCADWYDPKAYQNGDAIDPEPNTGGEQKFRVLRGGSWIGSPLNCRAAYRRRNEPDERGSSIGFRIVFCTD